MKTKTIKGSSQIGVTLTETMLFYLYENMLSFDPSIANNQLHFNDLKSAYNNKELLITINNYSLSWGIPSELYPDPDVSYTIKMDYTGDNKAIIEAVKIWEAEMEDINGEWDGIEADEAEGEDEPIHESTEERLAYFAVNWKDSQDLLSEDKIEELRTAFDDDIVEIDFNEEYPSFPSVDAADQHLIYFKDNPQNMVFMWINVREGLISKGYSSNGTDARRELYKLNHDAYVDILDHVLDYINLTHIEYKNLSSDFQLEVDKVVREIFEYVVKVKYEG